MNKEQLRNLIKEVVSEMESSPVLPNLDKAEGREVEIKLKLQARGLKSNKRLKQFVDSLKWDAKKADLELIRAELIKSGKIEPPEPEAPEYVSKKIEKPPMTGTPEEWAAMTKRDVSAMRKAAAERRRLGLPPEEDDDNES